MWRAGANDYMAQPLDVDKLLSLSAFECRGRVVHEKVEDIAIYLLLKALYQCYHYDFATMHAPPSNVGCAKLFSSWNSESFSELLASLLHNPSILPRLLDYLTIQVSEIFWDPSYYCAIRRNVAAPLKRIHP